MPDNECIAFYDPGNDLNGEATGTITGKRFVKVSAAKRAGSEGLASDTLGGRIRVAQCSVAGEMPIGVSGYDADTGDPVPVIRGHKVVPVTSGAAVSAGAKVMTDSSGRAIPWVTAASDANEVIGIQLNTTTTSGQVAVVALNI